MSAAATFSSHEIQLQGIRVHYVEAGSPAGGPTFVLVHGLGGSAANWSSLIPLLAAHGRVLALDLGGFGFTYVPHRQAGVAANRTLLQRFVQATCERPVILVGNSMGGLITAQLAAGAPQLVAGAVLIDPALPPTPRARPHPLVTAGFAIHLLPGLDRRILAARESKYTPEQLVRGTIQLVTSDRDRIDPEVIDEHVQQAVRRAREYPDGNAAFCVAARTLLGQLAARPRLTRMFDRVLPPVLLLHGDRDLLVHVRAARALARRHPGWAYVEGAGMAHTPFLDHPDWVAEQVLDWTRTTLS